MRPPLAYAAPYVADPRAVAAAGGFAEPPRLTPDVQVTVPFYCYAPWARGHTERAEALREVRRYLEPLCRTHGWALIQTSGANTAAARNRALHSAAETLVFCDADTLNPAAQLARAVVLAQEEPGLVFSFTRYVRLGRVENTAPEAILEQSCSSGGVAISAACFRELGGYDERFGRMEDLDFARRAAARWPLRRVEGSAYHLWHPRPAVEPEDDPHDRALLAELEEPRKLQPGRPSPEREAEIHRKRFPNDPQHREGGR